MPSLPIRCGCCMPYPLLVICAKLRHYRILCKGSGL
nr:MAG TPA: hypothetical protein [Caudoviricetes sp.]